MGRAIFYLSMGSNMGDRRHHIQTAIHKLKRHHKICVSEISSIYETDPVGYTEQNQFLNLVIKGETTLTPEQLLNVTQSIEKHLGRTREIHWGPRTIDIDILLYNSIRMRTKHLEIPHPRIHERAFVLVPLAEIAPDVTIPGYQLPAQELCQKVGREGVQRWINR